MKDNKDALGNRMKGYEDVSRIYLTKRSPVIIRIDGRAFHTFTRGFKKPFDRLFIKAMQETAKYLCGEITGCKLAYIQSDEISLLLIDYDSVGTQPWFENNLQKLVSVSASMATLAFNRAFVRITERFIKDGDDALNESETKYVKSLTAAVNRGAVFDARAFIIPKEEVCNYFIWRQQDATRNSILSVAQSELAPSEIHGKTCDVLQDMLFTRKGINWNNYAVTEKRGACVVKRTVLRNGAERYEWVADEDIPVFTKDRNYIEKYVYLKAD